MESLFIQLSDDINLNLEKLTQTGFVVQSYKRVCIKYIYLFIYIYEELFSKTR